MKYNVVDNKGQMLNLSPPLPPPPIDKRITNQVLWTRGLTPYRSGSSWRIPAVCYR